MRPHGREPGRGQSVAAPARRASPRPVGVPDARYIDVRGIAGSTLVCGTGTGPAGPSV
jgi:hypothetical protein